MTAGSFYSLFESERTFQSESAQVSHRIALKIKSLFMNTKISSAYTYFKDISSVRFFYLYIHFYS